MTALLRRAFGQGNVLWIARIASVVSVVVVLATFLVAALLVRAALGTLNHQQADLRQARLGSALLLSLQLDEETGVRGYAATRDRRFVAPYFNARSKWKTYASAIVRQIGSVDDKGGQLAAAEREVNARWNQDVARPILAHPATGRRVGIEIHGKYLVDDFRNIDAELFALLSNASGSLDAKGAALVGRILAISLGLGVIVSLLIGLAATFLIATLEEMRVQRQAYEDEKRVTGILQGAFVQKVLPKFEGVAFDAVYKPATDDALVGGDWYDAVELPDGRILFSIGDVVGHGVQAAVDMTRVRQSIAAIGTSESDPGKVLTLVNRVLELQTPIFVTALCGYIHLETRTVRYASAGHPVPLAGHATGSTSPLQNGGTPLGVIARAYEAFEYEARPGDLLVFYTDGAIEYGRDVQRGERRLREIVSEAAKRKSSDPAHFIYRRVFREGAPSDDVAILTARFLPAARVNLAPSAYARPRSRPDAAAR